LEKIKFPWKKSNSLGKIKLPWKKFNSLGKKLNCLGEN
jgi:hypothetical protein